MENQIVNIDSRFRDKTLFKNAGKFTHTLMDKLKNVHYVRVSSIELPNMYYTFTAVKDNLSFQIVVDDYEFEVHIAEGSYTSDLILNYIQDELTVINTDHGYNFKISFSEISSRISFYDDDPTPTSFTINFSNQGLGPSLGYHLGFRENVYSGAGRYTSESVLDTVGDHYVYVRVNDYGLIYNDVANRRLLAKVILNKNKTFLVQDNEANFLTKTYKFHQPVNVDRLEIELLDPLGRTLDLVGQDYSMTLEVGVIRDAVLKDELENKL